MKEHVIINLDRTVNVPESMKKIGIQYDHNVKTITFDCPRYPDENQSVDMSSMKIFINWMLPDKTLGSTIATNVCVDSENENLMHFDWVITKAVTSVSGVLSTLICIKETTETGEETYHWNSELIQSFKVGNGMECTEEIVEQNIDVITQLLVQMDAVNTRTSEEALERHVENYLTENPPTFSDQQADESVRKYMEENAQTHVDDYLERNPLTLDETLTDSTKAAPADLVGELKGDLVNQKEFIYEDGLRLKKEIKTDTTIFIDREMKNVLSNLVPISIYHSNRFDYTKMSTSVNSYNGSHTITKENNGLKIVRNVISASTYLMNLYKYTSEFSGNLWFSCDIKAENVSDAMVKIKVNDIEKESIYGVGHVYACIPVNTGDVVTLLFYTDIGNTTTGNTIYYSNIMLQYEAMTDEFIPYTVDSDNSTYLTKTIILDGINLGKFDDWTTMNTRSGKYYFLLNNKLSDMLDETTPTVNTDIGNWETNFNQISSYDLQGGSVDGLAVFTNKSLGIFIDSIQKRATLPTYLQSNPIFITYTYSKDGVKAIDSVTVGDILVSEESISLSGYCKEESNKIINYVAMGDSITGMFSYGTSYPEMIAKNDNRINAFNCGFSGSQVTDHSNENYKAFSFNRLVNAIVNNDWTLQDSAVENITTAHYSENLARLKTIDFSKVDYLSLLYGTNDWGSSVSLDIFKSVYVSSITTLLTKYPNLKVIIISPYWRSITTGKDSNIDANGNNEYLYQFSDGIEELAKKNFNCPTLNLYWNLGANAITNRYFTQDGTHPTFSTRLRIANMIDELLD